MNIYDPRRPDSCVVPYSQTSTGSGSKNLLSTIPVYVPTPKLCRKINFLTLLDPIAQCKTPGNTMAHYKPGVTAQSRSPYSPELLRSGSLPTYIPTPKSVLSARNPNKCFDDDVLKLLSSIIKDAEEGKWSYFSRKTEPSKKLKPSWRQKLFKSFRDSFYKWNGCQPKLFETLCFVL